jgi:hypothetical protein
MDKDYFDREVAKGFPSRAAGVDGAAWVERQAADGVWRRWPAEDGKRVV